MAYDDSALTLLVWLFIGLPSRICEFAQSNELNPVLV